MIAALRGGPIEIKGRMPWSSNGTFLVGVGAVDTNGGGDGRTGGDDRAGGDSRPAGGCDAIYKPLRGERPLWDFPDGLYRREVAAYELAVALGWDLVPETVVREDAPLGIGSLQRFVTADFSEHYFTILDDEATHDQLRRIAVFDLIANNTDRKGGHCLLGLDGHIWAIDNGLCFAVEPKLRTVIWDFAGEPIARPLLDTLEALLARGFPAALEALLHPDELGALDRRIRRVLASGTYPEPSGGHPWPWPLV